MQSRSVQNGTGGLHAPHGTERSVLACRRSETLSTSQGLEQGEPEAEVLSAGRIKIQTDLQCSGGSNFEEPSRNQKALWFRAERRAGKKASTVCRCPTELRDWLLQADRKVVCDILADEGIPWQSLRCSGVSMPFGLATKQQLVTQCFNGIWYKGTAMAVDSAKF